MSEPCQSEDDCPTPAWCRGKAVCGKVKAEGAAPVPATLLEWLRMCAADEEFVRQFDRLRGTNVGRKGSPITLAIDEATGKFEADSRAFFDFCVECWKRQTKKALIAQFDADLAAMTPEQVVEAFKAAGVEV